MADYTQDIADARADIEAAGRFVTYTRKAPQTRSSAGSYSKGSPLTKSVYVLQKRENTAQRRNNRQDAGSGNNVGTKLFLMGSYDWPDETPIEPVRGDTIVFGDGSKGTVHEVDSLSPDGTPILWYLYVEV